jgi:hypothetical protein
VDWINPTGARKVHSLIDKVYKRKNLEMAWEMVKANRGSGGVDGQSLDGFAAQLDQQLDRLQSELKEDVYRPQPVRQVQIPKAGKPGEFRTLGIPTIYDRVAYPVRVEVTKHDMPGRKNPGCPAAVCAAVGTIWGVSKLGGRNMKKYLQPRKHGPARSRDSRIKAGSRPDLR